MAKPKHTSTELDAHAKPGGGWIQRAPSSVNGKSDGGDPNPPTALLKAWAKPTFDGWYSEEERSESPAAEVAEIDTGKEQ